MRTDVVDAERVGLVVLVLLHAAADLVARLPPLVVEHLDDALLLQLQDGQRDLVPPWRSWWVSDKNTC